MIVIFVSECRKKSIKHTQRILDTYAYRIGRRTWQANMTEQGLAAVRQRLTKEATRSTAIACHVVTSRKQTELVWVVGNRRVFDSRGCVAVHRTRVTHPRKYNDGMWPHLPMLKDLARMAALWHDFGKASDLFQRSLQTRKSCDLLRHEWLSVCLFTAFVGERDDRAWLKDLFEVNHWFADDARLARWIEDAMRLARDPMANQSIDQPIAKWLKWLIVSHHLLPHPPKHTFNDDRAVDWNSIVADIKPQWGYHKAGDDEPSREAITQAFMFSGGLPTRSKDWRDAVVAGANQLLEHLNANVQSRWEHPSEIERPLLTLCRLTLMRGDHDYSGSNSVKLFKSDYPLYANTCRIIKDDRNVAPTSHLNQRLDEHLVGVAESTNRIAKQLPYLQSQLPVLEIPRELRKPSTGIFGWQTKAVDTIREKTHGRPSDRRSRPGTLIINTAGTGTGKTTANAKMLAALNPDDLRVAFTLGLRTLTLQTGDEYRERLQLRRSDMEVIIGSKAVKQLHESKVDHNDDHSLFGGPGSFDVPDEEFFYGEVDPHSEQQQKLQQMLQAPNDRRFLLAPFLICTIDHLISAVDGVRAGHQVIPMLRMLSSDLVIDEIDDYDTRDLIAVLRLVHLAGMMGRDVLISSATITPSIARAAFDAFHQGRRSFAAFQDASSSVEVLWTDEFKSKMEACNDGESFDQLHAEQMQRKAQRLAKGPVKRRGKVFAIGSRTQSISPSAIESPTMEQAERERHATWVSSMASAAIELHHVHRQIDPITSRRYSIGLIRTANIDPCVSVAMHLMDRELPAGVEVRLITYHSRHVLLMRSEIESYLGKLLYRRDDRVLADRYVRQHLDQSNANDVIFIVVASPVCEVGRDHDYDWTVAEPSSFRSLIQIVGRVRRHRGVSSLNEPNVYVANLNYRAYVRGEDAAFVMPGFEDTGFTREQKRRLRTKRIDELLDVAQLAVCIDSRPRIVPAKDLDPEGRLADLEHAVLGDILNSASRAAYSPHGWNTGCHYLIDTAQQATRFRASLEDCKLYLDAEPADDSMPFRLLEQGDGIGAPVKLPAIQLAKASLSRLWLPPMNYAEAIDLQSDRFGLDALTACKRFGELVVLDDMLEKRELIWAPQCGAFRDKD